MRPIERWDVDFRTQRSLAIGDWQLKDQMRTVTFEQIMRKHRDQDIAIADGTVVGTCFPLTLDPNTHPVIDSGWDRDGQFCLLVTQA